MNAPKDTLYIDVEYNNSDEEYGPVYIATNDTISLVTDGSTFEELLKNLREAIAVCFEDTDTITEFGIIPNPHIVITLKLPENYAETA